MMFDEALMLELNYFFDFDQEKIYKWMRTPNPLLADLSPEDMVLTGREDKLRKFILNSLNGDRP